jgi:hypothetical protein
LDSLGHKLVTRLLVRDDFIGLIVSFCRFIIICLTLSFAYVSDIIFDICILIADASKEITEFLEQRSCITWTIS